MQDLPTAISLTELYEYVHVVESLAREIKDSF